MIRYDITEVDLLAQIDREKADWRTRAATATALFRQAKTYHEPPSPFWGEIKAVYMRLQKNKCAFCERKLTVRSKDHDVEHFRPKRGVEAWPLLAADAPFSEGYYLLAYHPLNYATTCEHCNRGLKRSYFPIVGARLSGQDNPTNLSLEQPLLIYPIGQIDTDPEVLLGFKGTAPSPRNADPDSYENHRAQVTIDFFDLQYREELLRERAEVIETLHHLLVLAHRMPDSRRQRKVQTIIRRKQSSGSQHANCARCFVALYRQDPAEAERLVDKATDYLDSLIPAD